MTMDRRFDNRPKVKGNRLPENPQSESADSVVGSGRFPSWLHRRLPRGGNLWKTGQLIEDNQLHTVCEEARCPNLLECWSRKTATFLVMGKECTRSCGFCDIDFAKAPAPLDSGEPARVADSVARLGLRHVVLTMVARDDLPDGGAMHLASIMQAIKQLCEDVTLEVLTSDFDGNWEALDLVLDEEPLVFNHNIETVEVCTPRVRHRATYARSLELLSHAKGRQKCTHIKSGLMVGLGESKAQVEEALRDLKGVGCDIVTIGQYLQPNRKKLTVRSFVTPEQFKEYELYGLSIGLSRVYAGPFVRSSYNADAFAGRRDAHG